MMNGLDIVNVTEADFEEAVLAYSHNVPVLVEFWAEWSLQSKELTPRLEKLTRESRGVFRLARVNVDDNRNLSIRYGIRGIPTVKAFVKGQVTAEFSGTQPELKLKEFLHTLAPSPADLIVNKGQALLTKHDWQAAKTIFSEALEMDENNAPSQLGYLTCLAALGEVNEAINMIEIFPASHEYSMAQNLLPLMLAYQQLLTGQEAPQGDLDAAYWNSIRLAYKGNTLAGIDGLLDLLRKNKRYGNGSARAVVVALLQLLGENDPDALQYRAELASILF